MASDVRISPLRPEFIDVLWPEVVRMMGPAVTRSNGRFSLDNVRAAMLDGGLVLWLVVRDRVPLAVYTTRIAEYPSRRALVIDWLGGADMPLWIDAAIEDMKQHACTNKCHHLEFCGRVGWKRVLVHRGWKAEYVAYRMELSNE